MKCSSKRHGRHPDIVKDDENSLIEKRADKYILGWLFLLLRTPEPIVNLRRCHITLRRWSFVVITRKRKKGGEEGGIG